MAATPTLNDLEDFIRGHDPAGTLKNVSYSMSYNTKIGFNDDKGPFVAIPYGTWERYEDWSKKATQPTDVLGNSFKAAVDAGRSLTTTFGDTFIIDITMLDEPHRGFMTEKIQVEYNKKKASPIEHLKELINGLPPTTQPVIRFLIGASRDQTPQKFKNDLFQIWRDIFWSKDDKATFDHKEAILYIGYYSPSVKYVGPFHIQASSAHDDTGSTPQQRRALPAPAAL